MLYCVGADRYRYCPYDGKASFVVDGEEYDDPECLCGQCLEDQYGAAEREVSRHESVVGRVKEHMEYLAAKERHDRRIAEELILCKFKSDLEGEANGALHD